MGDRQTLAASAHRRSATQAQQRERTERTCSGRGTRSPTWNGSKRTVQRTFSRGCGSFPRSPSPNHTPSWATQAAGPAKLCRAWPCAAELRCMQRAPPPPTSAPSARPTSVTRASGLAPEPLVRPAPDASSDSLQFDQRKVGRAEI